MSVAALVLAAGGGRRFEGAGHKLLAPFGGDRVVGCAVRAALEAGLDDTFVVTGAVDLRGVLPSGVTIVSNEAWEQGLARSLRAGVGLAQRDGHDAVVVGLGDQPLVPATAWRALAGVEEPLAVATYRGRRGHPVRLGRSVWDQLPVDGDEGARRLLASWGERVREVPCEGEPADIDTLEDLARWS